MTLDEFVQLYPKIKRSERGQVDLIKRTVNPDGTEEGQARSDASFVVFYKLKETGSHAQIADAERDWPLPRSLS